MKWISLLLILISFRSHALECFYDFGTKSFFMDQKKGVYKKTFVKDNHKYFVRIDMEKPSEINDYLVKETLDGEYRMTYSLKCQ